MHRYTSGGSSRRSHSSRSDGTYSDSRSHSRSNSYSYDEDDDLSGDAGGSSDESYDVDSDVGGDTAPYDDARAPGGGGGGGLRPSPAGSAAGVFAASGVRLATGGAPAGRVEV